MKIRLFLLAAFLFSCIGASAQSQFAVTEHREGWDEIPAAAIRRGYNFQRSELVQMDDDAQYEDVMLFGKDNGHWPEFDLFKFYVVIIGHYDKKVKYMSDEMVTDKYNLLVEDRDEDGKCELYVSYIKDGSFKVDERGYNMQAVRCFDRIELKK